MYVEEDQNFVKNEEKEDGEIEDNPVAADGPCCKRHKTNDGNVSSYQTPRDVRVLFFLFSLK